MTTWTSGYVADIGYTFGYYAELNPLRARLGFLNSGLAFPSIETACELGFGQGLSANIHSAASNVQWWGTDFNPAQAGFAQGLAGSAGLNTKLFDEAFADFAARPDLPEFDFIGLHGIWSWISDTNRQVIVDFVRRRLKVGGVLYISYNTLPGWAAFAPMRHLMTEHAEVLGSEGRGIVSRIDGALEFASKLLETNPLFARANPLVADRINGLKGQNRHYLAHEYFNRDWHPMHFATMAGWLEPAKLQFAASAHYLDQFDALNLTAEQQAFLADVPDPMFRQSVRDFMVNQQFRRDYWVKGARRLSTLDQTEQLRAQRLVLTTHRADVSLKVKGSLGEATMNESVYKPILDCMADHRARSIGEIQAELGDPRIDFVQVLQTMIVLVGAGHVSAVQDMQEAQSVRDKVSRLNVTLLNRARGSGDIAHLASALTAGGISMGWFEQMFLGGVVQKGQTAAQLAEHAWQLLSNQGQKVLKDGKPLQTKEENLAELTRQAESFILKKLPLLKSLQVI
jgi:SAM-dependent methyltransferase